MSDPRFLTVDDVLAFHAEQLSRFGGQQGLRDVNLLESAVAMPQAGFGNQYLHTDLFEMAAAYLFHIVQNHPFLDGNKRTGALAAYVFLRMNGYQISASQESFEELVRQVATGMAEKPAIADFLRRNVMQVQ